MKIEIVNITPQTAAAWLEVNENFRKPIKGYAERLAVDMIAGKWDLNGDAIRFNANGKLIDGQHRLRGCVIAKTAFKSVVVWGVEYDGNIDGGAKRSLAQILDSRGEKNTTNLAASIRGAWLLQSGLKCWSNNAQRPTNQMLLAWFDANPTIRESLKKSEKCYPLFARSVCAALHHAFSHKDANMAEDFIEVLAGKVVLGANDPVMMFREKLIQNKSSKFKMNARQLYAYGIVAWNYWRKGATVKCLKWTESGVAAQEFPEII
jgi:hypothetical protein